MAGVHALPTHGGVFLDDRGDDRSLRVSWHPESGVDGVVVLSLWRDSACVATFRLRAEEVDGLVAALRSSGDEAADTEASSMTGTGARTRHDRAC